jgi:hypothetical protein
MSYASLSTIAQTITGTDEWPPELFAVDRCAVIPHIEAYFGQETRQIPISLCSRNRLICLPIRAQWKLCCRPNESLPIPI